MRNVSPRVRVVITAALMLATFALGWALARGGLSQPDPPPLSELEARFSERMTNVVLIGQFTVTGREDRGPSEDRYEIASVTKVGDDRWRVLGAHRVRFRGRRVADHGDDGLGGRHADDHDDRFQHSHARHIHGAGLLLRRPIRRDVAARRRRRPHVRADRGQVGHATVTPARTTQTDPTPLVRCDTELRVRHIWGVGRRHAHIQKANIR